MASRTKYSRKRQSPQAPLAAHAACLWAFAFAGMSFYWALGGTAGVGTLGDIANPEFAGNPWFLAVVWITGLLKALGGLAVLALVRPWGRIVPRRLLVAAIGFGGLLMLMYGGANFLVRGLMWMDFLDTPESMHSAAARWHLWFWNPWWLLGGILFSTACLQAIRRSGYQPGGKGREPEDRT